MTRNSTEELISQLQRSRRSDGLLVPKIELFMQEAAIEIEDDEDREYLRTLILARSQPRKKGVYSPSMLAECVRKVYFLKTGVRYQKTSRLEANGFFHDGNWRHFKWQFALWKMHRAGVITLVDVGSICLGAEIHVANERGDFAGTLDNLVYVPDDDIVCTVDYKGMNGNSFSRSVATGPSMQYILQSVGYAGLANQALLLDKKIKDVIIVGENKNGPIKNRVVKAPLGLVEWRYNVQENRHLVSARVKRLRGYENRQETPPAECISTRQMKFKDCPFAPVCRADVERVERKNARKPKKKTPPKVQFSRKKR